MRLLRGILGFLLAIILLASAGLALGSYAVAETVSENAVEKAITETDAVGKLTDNIIEHNTINLGGVYGDTMQAILKSDAMTEFFTAYTTRCLQSQVYGGEMEELGADDLNAAFSRGTDECIENGSISMDRGERALFDEALNTAMPNLTKGINYVLSQMNLTSFVDEDTANQIELAQTATSTEVRYGAAGIAILACVLLFALYWRSKFGMLLSGIMILIVAAFFFVLSMMIDQTVESSGTGLVLSRQMLYIMVSYGAQQAVRLGAIIGGAMIVGCPIFKLVFRSRQEESNMSFAEFEREVALQGKVMAISRVYLKDETPTHTFGCFFRLFDRILGGETIVTGLGFCGCKGFESNSGLKDELPCIPGGFGKFLTTGSKAQWTPDGERFKCDEATAYGLYEGLPKNVMEDGKGGRYDGLKFEPYREGLDCDVVVCLCNPDQLSAVIVLHGYDKPEYDRVIATTSAGCASLVRIPLDEKRREKPRAVITGSDLAQRKFRPENEIAIAIPSEDFEYMMSVTDECFFHAPVWKPVRNRLRKDERLQDACFTALGTVE